jgi:hypothetical protein
VALVWALFCTLVIAGLVFAGTTSRIAMDHLASSDFSAHGQAEAVAQAGIVDAYAWFRRQTVQPVTTFAPRRDLAATPPVNETDDATIGLVREFEIMPSLWARYEVRPGAPGEAFTDSDADGRHDAGEPFVDANGNGVRDPARDTRDVSAERGLTGSGLAWRIVSHGFLYRRQRDDLPLGEGPNVRVAYEQVAGEVRRLTITPPASAAICVRNGSSCVIGSRSRVLGGVNGGIVSTSGTGSPSIAIGSEVQGSPAVGSLSPFADTIENLFGVTIGELKGTAEASYTDPASVPGTVGQYTLTVITGNIVFDGSRPLRGTGIVVIDGNCTLAAGSNSFFSGLLYVKGNLTLRSPAYLRGTLIVTGSVNVSGTGGDYVEIDYDPSTVSNLLTLMGQYRHSTVAHPVVPLLSDGTPDEVGGRRGTGGMGSGGGGGS